MENELTILWKNKINAKNFEQLKTGLTELAEEVPVVNHEQSINFFNLSRIAPALCLTAVLIFIYSGDIKNSSPTTSEVALIKDSSLENSLDDLALLFDDSQLFEEVDNINMNFME